MKKNSYGQRVTFGRTLRWHTLEMAKMYYVFSDTKHIDSNLKEYMFDVNAKPIIDTIGIGAKRSFNANYENMGYAKENHVLCDKNVIVCFSGGKDSTAAAITMRNNGMNVYLYYVQGINKSYPNEYEQAKKIAKYLNMPLIVDKVILNGTSDFHDNPVKNQMIASMALDYGVGHEITTRICFGDFYTDNIENSSFLEAWSDCQEMWKAHKEYVRKYVPQYEIIIPFKNYIQTMDIIASDNNLLNMVQGCVLPYRFRETTKEKNENKYGITLLNNRCGSCWKCCVEYIHYADIGVLGYNKDFYVHCLDFLKEKMGVLHNEIQQRDYRTVYETFLYTCFEKSKLYNHDEYR